MTIQANLEWNKNKSNQVAALAKNILHRLFKEYQGTFAVRLWNDTVLQIGEGLPVFTLAIKHNKVLYHLVWFRDPIRLAEAYFNGDVEVSGDFNAAVGLRYYLEKLSLPVQEKLQLAFQSIKLGIQKQKSFKNDSFSKRIMHFYRHNTLRQNDVESIAFHYDVPNAFYKLWLDERMVY